MSFESGASDLISAFPENAGGAPLSSRGIHQVKAMEIAQLAGMFFEALMLGIFVMIYSKGTWLLIRGDQPTQLKRRNFFLLAANTIMLIASLTHLSLTMFLTVYILVTRGDNLVSIYEAFGDSMTDKVGVAQFVLYATQGLIGDGFMLYRLWVVWDRRWKIAFFPALLFLANGVCGYAMATNLEHGAALIFYILSLVTNLVGTTLIMSRLLHTGADARLAPAHWSWRRRASHALVRYRRVVEAIIESAAVYSFASIALLITFFVSPNVGYSVLFCIISPLVGIVFSLIVVHIARNSALPDPMAGAQTSTVQLSGLQSSATFVSTRIEPGMPSRIIEFKPGV